IPQIGSSRRGAVNEPPTIQSKPYALPLRMPPSATRVEIHKLKVDPHDPPETPKPDTFKNKKRPPSVDTGSSISSPQLRRALKTTKVPEEPRDTKIPSMVPLEHSEHQWLVTCASGHWSQVYGLLLRDSQLAEKRDFMSGFTALHWAAKCGNGDMLVKIIDLAKQEGVDIDINAKTHGGYTPLHIAALHNQEYMMAMLVGEYEANVNIRDNNGKKASHYLHKGVSSTVRDMLAGPKPRQAQDKNLEEKEELDLVPDLSKSLHSISRIFQPHGTVKTIITAPSTKTGCLAAKSNSFMSSNFHHLFSCAICSNIIPLKIDYTSFAHLFMNILIFVCSQYINNIFN
uniref:Ankyrin repeat domain-containing protein SOWAHB-like n=1 Tax=Mastacembelus armatus TaxID=205130 RepID=A0A3Q3NGY3_9TELE